MRTITIIALSAALVAAIVSGLMLYQRYHGAQEALQASEEKVAELSSKLTQLREETETLHDQITVLEGTRNRVSELEHAITQKDHAFSKLNETIRILTRDLEKEREITERTTSQLTMKKTMVNDLEDHVQGLHSTSRYLEEEVARSQIELEELQGTRTRISKLEQEIIAKDNTLTGCEETIHILERDLTEERRSKQLIEAELTSRNATLTEVQKQLRDVQSRARYLEEQLAEKDKELKRLEVTLRTLRGEKASAEASIDELRSTYESLIAGLKERIEQQEVSIERFEQEILVTFVDRILFEFGRAAVTPEGEEVLRQVGQILKEVEDRKIRVVGHTEDRPIHPDYRYKFPSNWELSSARASAVVRYLQEEIGIAPTI